MQVRCQRCGFVLTLGREEIAAALEELERTQAQHHNVTCRKCRHQVKVPAAEFRRARPATTA